MVVYFYTMKKAKKTKTYNTPMYRTKLKTIYIKRRHRRLTIL